MLDNNYIVVFAQPVTAANIILVKELTDESFEHPIYQMQVWGNEIVPAVKSMYTDKTAKIYLFGPYNYVAHISETIVDAIPNVEIEILDPSQMENE